MIRRLARTVLAAGLLVSWSPEAVAREWFVAPGATGTGTRAAPFGSVQAAIVAARPGDTILLGAGTYHEFIRTIRNGLPGAPITVRAEHAPRSAVITAPGTVLQVDHSFFVAENLVFDAAYARRTAVSVSDLVTSLVLRGVEVRRSSRDCVDIGAAVDVLIDDSLIHHCLNAANGRTDAHGVVAGAVRGLTIRGTEIHSFSGDAVQLNRTGTGVAAGWNDVLIEGCRLWLAPLAEAANGFPEGAVTGENALDTKVAATSPRATITIRDTQAWGFGGGMIRVQAAFNLKEHIDAIVDGVTVWNSNIAFRLRGSSPGQEGARVRIQNTVIHDVAVGIRYEDDIRELRVWNTTFGSGVARAFADVSSAPVRPDVRNAAVLGRELPSEAAHDSNLAVAAQAFVDAIAGDYRPAAASPLVDAGMMIGEVELDRARMIRPQGRTHDVGAYERR